MALTLVSITGRAPLPDGAAPPAAEITFRLSAMDSQDDALVLPAAARAVLDAEGDLPENFALWCNAEGTRGTHYTVRARWSEASPLGAIPREVTLGRIAIAGAGPYTLAELLDSYAPLPGVTAVVPLTQAEYDALDPPDEGTWYLIIPEE